VSGYVLMRVIMIVQWLRAAKAAPEQRSATIAYACGIGLAQVLWVLWLLIDAPVAQAAAFIVLVGLELSIPIFAESRGTTPWHPEHITDRYGCFTIIVLGESLLASANAVFGALSDVVDLIPLISLGVLSLIVTAAMWWIYFWPPHHRAISGLRGSIKYGYGHYFIFAAAGAFSAGVGIEVDSQLGRSALDPVLATFTVSVPIAVFVLGVWLLAAARSMRSFRPPPSSSSSTPSFRSPRSSRPSSWSSSSSPSSSSRRRPRTALPPPRRPPGERLGRRMSGPEAGHGAG